MCSYKVLFHKASGYVVKCNSCSSYQIAFGTMVFTISTQNMVSLFEDVAQLERKGLRAQSNPRERFQVKLPCESVIMALTIGELKQFYSMLEESFVVEELKQLLTENNVN